MPSAAEIARALGGARRSGDSWQARCPAHDDRTPSLSIAQRNGKLLVHCFAGCRQADVIAALRQRGLWPQPEAAHDPEAWRREHERRREAQRFARAARLLAEWVLEALPFHHPDRRDLTELLERLKLDPGAELDWFRKHHLALTVAMVAAARTHEGRLRQRAEQWVAALAAEVRHAA